MSDFTLGRGLHSLIPKKDEPHRQIPRPQDGAAAQDDIKKESIFFLEVDSVLPNPHQPRREFDEATLTELAHSIREHGVLQPIVVSKVEYEMPSGRGVRYELIAGERRLKAAKIAGLPHIPAVVRRKDSEQKTLEMALVENIQREDLNPMERAFAYEKFAGTFGLTQNEIAEKIGKNRATVANTMRLLNLPKEIQDALKEGKITEGHARAILALSGEEEQLILFRKILLHGASVREAESHVRERKARVSGQKYIDPNLRDLILRIEDAVGTKVNFSPKKEGGRLQIEFYSKEDLYKFLDRLGS